MRAIDPRLRRLLLVACLLASAACTALPAASPTASPPDATEAPPTAIVEPTSTAFETAVPPTEIMSPGQFWNFVGGVDLVKPYDTLDAIIDASDLIVVAAITGFSDGRRIEISETGETMYMAEVRAHVTEALKGAPVTPPGEAETIIVESSYGFSADPAFVANLDASTPVGARVVLFLANKAAEAVRLGLPPDHPTAGEQFYLLLRGDQAAIRDEQGTARIGPGEQTPEWVGDVDGRPFDEVVAAIKDAIASS